MRTCIKAWMSSNFGQIPLLTWELAALERLKNRCCHFFFGCCCRLPGVPIFPIFSYFFMASYIFLYLETISYIFHQIPIFLKMLQIKYIDFQYSYMYCVETCVSALIINYIAIAVISVICMEGRIQMVLPVVILLSIMFIYFDDVMHFFLFASFQ